MAKVTATESDFEIIPEGSIVAARVKSIEEQVLEFGPRFNWKFEVTEAGPYQGYTVNANSSQKFVLHENCKLMNWAIALLQRTFEEGEGLDTDDLIGLDCRILIEHQPDRDDPEKMWMRVADVMPPRGKSMAAEDVFG